MPFDPTVPSLPSWAERSIPQDIAFLYRASQGVSPFQMIPEHWEHSKILMQARLLCWACGRHGSHLPQQAPLSPVMFVLHARYCGIGCAADPHSAICVRCVGPCAPSLTPAASLFSSAEAGSTLSHSDSRQPCPTCACVVIRATATPAIEQAQGLVLASETLPSLQQCSPRDSLQTMALT